MSHFTFDTHILDQLPTIRSGLESLKGRLLQCDYRLGMEMLSPEQRESLQARRLRLADHITVIEGWLTLALERVQKALAEVNGNAMVR